MLIIFVSLVTSLSISISNKHTIGDKIVGIELVSINKGSDSLLKWKALYRNIIYITSITLIIISYGNTIEFINYILLTVGIQIYWIPNEVWGKLCLLDFVSKTRYEIVH